MRFNEQGYSIMELMIATGILGILAALYANSQPRMERDAARQSMKEEGRDQLISVLNFMRKNAKGKVAGTPYDIIGHGLQFSQRLTDGTLRQIRIQSKCRAISLEPLTILATEASDAQCLERIGCKGLPYVEIQQQDADGSIKALEFPSIRNFEASMRRKFAIGGLGFCVDQQMDSLSIRAIGIGVDRSIQGSSQIVLDGVSYQMLQQARNSVELIRQ